MVIAACINNSRVSPVALYEPHSPVVTLSVHRSQTYAATLGDNGWIPWHKAWKLFRSAFTSQRLPSAREVALISTPLNENLFIGLLDIF